MREAERHTLFLNPYPDHRFHHCPRCGRETHKRNRVLIAQSGPDFVAPAMATCRYCTKCDLLIAHQDEIEQALREMLPPHEQEKVLGGQIAVFGTLDRSQLAGDVETITPNELFEAFHPIEDVTHFEMARDEKGNLEWVEVEHPYPDMLAEVPLPAIEEVQALPQVEERWEVAARELQSWILDEEEGPYRPYGTLVVSTAGPLVVFHDLSTDKPSSTDVRNTLLKAMSHPTSGAGEPRRPTSLVIDDESLVEPLKFEMNALNIRCETGPTPEVDEALAELEYYLAGEREPIPGLLDHPGVTPELVGDLFEAAAEFYYVAPWEWMLDEDLIAVRYPVPDGEWRFASVMGHAGMEFGLAVFESLADYDRLATTPPGASIGMMDYRSLTYDDVTSMPFPDIEAARHYDWEVAAEDAYPIPVTFTKEEEVKRPGPREIEWYTVTLRVIVDFFDEYWPDDMDYVAEPTSETFVVPLLDEEVEVELRYPADLVLDEE